MLRCHPTQLAEYAPPAKAPPCKLIARAVIDGQEVVREVAGGVPSLSDAAEINGNYFAKKIVANKCS
jgi:hypothetical protein